MKRQLRVSADYIAVDFTDEEGKIFSTPFYVTPKTPTHVMYYDDEEKKFVLTRVDMSAGGDLEGTDLTEGSQWEGLTWPIPPADLLDPHLIQFYPVKPKNVEQ